ncbi:MAG: hypothetical protein QOG99_639 [Frankiales bacterium]|nr:hypothetical protein [Frankiales bacterium]
MVPPGLSDLRMYGECHGRHPQYMNPIESVPTIWDDARDDSFFRVVLHLMDARFLEAASSLLAANDSDLAPTL